MSEEPLQEAPCALTHPEFAVFTHELRNALTVIAGYTNMLRRPLQSEDRLAALDGIHHAVFRANALCDQAVSGHLAQGLAPVPRESVPLWVLAERVASEQRAVTGRVIEVCAPGDIDVTGDELALSRALSNLVVNAAKYSPADGPIEVSVALEARTGGSPVAVIDVADRGLGIPADQRERVFELFERLERDADAPGTGLGLAVVRDVIAAHGGSVVALDREGGGTIMRVELPVAE